MVEVVVVVVFVLRGWICKKPKNDTSVRGDDFVCKA